MHEPHTSQALRLDPSRKAMILSHPSGQQLVFGMDWSPLVGTNPQGQGLKRSRALRASHCVIAGLGARALGTTRLGVPSDNQKAPLHSAAAHFAQRFPAGAFACLIPFDGHGCWMVASHAGTVLANTDRWFADLGAAIEAIEPIRSRFPALQIQTESTLSGQDIPPWLLEKLTIDSRLQPVKRLSSLATYALLLVLLSMTAAGYVATQMLSERPAQQQAGPDALLSWRTALHQLTEHIPIHTYQSLESVIQSWRQVPVRPAGWRLRNIQCEALIQDWQCVAHFDRQHRFSLNQDLDRYRPADWTARFTPLESAAWIWRIPHQQVTHDWTCHAIHDDWMTHLQRIGLAFEHIQIGAGLVLPLQTPIDAQGQPFPRPSSLPVWRHRSLTLKGPLRSVVLLDGLKVPLRWRRAHLELGAFSGQGVASSSSLTIELTGEIFETRAP